MKRAKRAVALLLVMALCLFTVSGCSLEKETAEPAPTALSVGYSSLDGNYSPFFARTEGDRDVVDLMHVRLLSTDRSGRVITNGIKGETTSYNGTPYTYTGPADVVIITREGGTVDYNFTLRQDITFSDGKPLTANDVIFTMCVLCDPTYDGPLEFASLPIVGLPEYRRGVTPKWELMVRDTPAASAEGSPKGYYTAAEAMNFWSIYNRVGTVFAQQTAEWYMAEGLAKNIRQVAALMGYEDLPEEAQAIDLFNAIVDRRGYDVKAIDEEQVTVSFEELLMNALEDSQRCGVKTGESSPSIEGIKKTGTYTFTVTLEYLDTNALSHFCFPIAPLHCYGKSGLYNESKKTFGFTKGDLTAMRKTNTRPLGAGAYRLKHHEAGLVSLIANDKYYRGRPKIDIIHLKKRLEAGKINALKKQEIDLAVVDFGVEATKRVERINGGVLNGDVLSTRLIAETGNGYLNISADGVSVGGDPYSESSKHLRTALMIVFSYYRTISIADYYGTMATVPGYPFSNGDDLFVTDMEGNPIWLASDPSENREELMKGAVLGHLEAAGYSVEAGKVTAAPAGARLSYEVAFPGSLEKLTPAYLMLSKSKEFFSDIGIRIVLKDASNESEVEDLVNKEIVSIWCSTRNEATESMLYTYYFSGNAMRPAGGMQYLTEISDAELDQLLLMARAEQDEKKRASLYAACTELVEKQAVELPLYYREQAVIVRSGVVDISSLPQDMTGHYNWIREIETVRTVG